MAAVNSKALVLLLSIHCLLLIPFFVEVFVHGPCFLLLRPVCHSIFLISPEIIGRVFGQTSFIAIKKLFGEIRTIVLS